MKLTPILKNVLVRTAYIVISPIIYYVLYHFLFLIWILQEFHITIIGIGTFFIALTVIWFNIRKLAKPIRQLFIALFVLVSASVVFWYKVEHLSWSTYHNVHVYMPLCFVLLASLLPIFLRNLRAERFSISGKNALWIAVLWLDFAVAMPTVWFADEATYGIYMGRTPAAETFSNRYWPVYGFAKTTFWGFNDTADICVLTPADSTASNYRSTFYRHTWGSDILVDTLARDTIWLRERGEYYDPNRKTMENIEQMRLRRQWQYNVWQKIKGAFRK